MLTDCHIVLSNVVFVCYALGSRELLVYVLMASLRPVYLKAFTVLAVKQPSMVPKWEQAHSYTHPCYFSARGGAVHGHEAFSARDAPSSTVCCSSVTLPAFPKGCGLVIYM